MAEISAALVKQLREKTGAGMMECKKALIEAKGDIGEAETILRKYSSGRPARGLARA
jgi:elongation factor Ts